MGKILYPVGTPVTLRKFPDTEGLIVSKYVKGEKYPYRVGYFVDDEVSVEGKSKFSKKGLKRFNPTQTPVNTEAQPLKQTTKKCNCYTKAEIDDLMQGLLRDIYHDMGMMSQNNETNILNVAEITDRNFRAVSRSLKSMSHDDD